MNIRHLIAICSILTAGVSWAQVPTAWEPASPAWEVRDLCGSEAGTLFAATNTGIFRTQNEGALWTNCADPRMRSGANALYCDAGRLWACAREGLFRSTDAGATWDLTSPAPATPEVTAMIVGDGDALFLSLQDTLNGTNRTVRVSFDGGASWNDAGAGIVGGSRVERFVRDTSDRVFALAGSGVISYQVIYRWDRASASWVGIYSVPPSLLVADIAVTSANVFVGSTSNGMIVSTNNAVDWGPMGLYPTACTDVLIFPDDAVMVGTRGDGVKYSDDRGGHWATIRDGLPRNPIQTNLVDVITALYRSPNGAVFAGTRDSGVYRSTAAADVISDEHHAGAGVSLYPNPARTVLTVALSASARVRFLDLFGREVLPAVRCEAGRQVRADVAALAAGAYVCRIEYPDGRHMARMFVRR